MLPCCFYKVTMQDNKPLQIHPQRQHLEIHHSYTLSSVKTKTFIKLNHTISKFNTYNCGIAEDDLVIVA